MTTAIFTWNNADPATPEVLDKLFDNMGLGQIDTARPERPEQKAQAREAAKNYFTQVIEEEGEVTMGDVNVWGYVFYDAYLAGLAGKVHPQRS